MNSPRSPRLQDQNAEPLWLTVRWDDCPERCFELPPNKHRAIVVGSAPDADIRIEEAAPVAFFIERDDHGVWLTPAYADEALRIDTRKLDKRRRLYLSSVVEISNTKLRLRLRDTPPTLRGDALAKSPYGELDIDKVFEEYDVAREHAVTTEISRSSIMAAIQQPSTTAYSREELVPPDALPTRTIEMSPFDFDKLFGTELGVLEPQPTIELAPMRFEPVAPTQTPRRPQAKVLREMPAFTRAVPRPSGDTTEFEMPLVPSPQPSALTPKSGRLSSATFNDESNRPVMHSHTEQPAPAILAQLGLLTKRRPVAVIGGAAIGTLVMTVFLVGAAQLVGGRSKSKPSARPTTVVTAVAPFASRVLPPPATAVVSVDSAAVPAQESAAGAEDPAVAAALGHLFAGRLAEAEQAYRGLSAKYPAEASYRSIALMLGRRNSADCRPDNDIKKVCPVVKP